MAYTKIMPRRGTRYEWSTVNPILAEGEFAVEFPDTGIGTGLCRFKFGDGVKRYNDLAYAFDGTSASSILGGNAASYHLIQLRSDTEDNWLSINPILEENELTFDITHNAFKVGDGIHRWKDLPFSGRQFIFDFGDEDAPPVDMGTLAALSDDIEIEPGPSAVMLSKERTAKSVATLADLLEASTVPLIPEGESVESVKEREEQRLVEIDDIEDEEPVEENITEEEENDEDYSTEELKVVDWGDEDADEGTDLGSEEYGDVTLVEEEEDMSGGE